MATSIRINHDTTIIKLKKLIAVRGLHESLEQLLVALADSSIATYPTTHKGLIKVGDRLRLDPLEEPLTVVFIEDRVVHLSNGIELPFANIELYNATLLQHWEK